MDKAKKYIDEIVEYANRMGVKQGAIVEIEEYLLGGLNNDNTWWLFHQPSSYWIINYLVDIKLNKRILTWNDIERMDINEDAKDKIKSIQNCDLCKNNFMEEYQFQTDKDKKYNFFPNYAFHNYF